jgi:hypothetical protein
MSCSWFDIVGGYKSGLWEALVSSHDLTLYKYKLLCAWGVHNIVSLYEKNASNDVFMLLALRAPSKRYANNKKMIKE